MRPPIGTWALVLTSSAAFAALLLSLTGASPAVADDASALLAKHKAYVGWEFGDGAFRTLKVEGTVRKAGSAPQDEPYDSYVDLRSGVIHRVTHRSKSGTYDFGFTGKTFWYSNENGFTVQRLGDDTKTEVAEIVFFNEATTSLAATIRRNDTLSGVPVVVLREAIPNGVPLDLYEDPANGAYRRAVIDPDGDSTTIDVDAYGDVSGKKMITAWHFDGSKYRWVEMVTPNPTVADADLLPPPARARWTFGTSQPFHLDITDDRIYVDAIVDGVKGHFIFDTGASSTAVTNKFAARAKLHPVGETTVSGLSGSVRTKTMAVDTIEFPDGSKLEHLVVDTGIDDSSERFDGLLGFDLLAAAIVDVDLDAARMTLFDPAVSAPSGGQGFVVVPDLSDGTPAIPIKLNGTRRINATMDTGEPLYVLLSGELSTKVGMQFDYNRLGSVVGIGGAVGGAYSDALCGTMRNITIGPISYDSAPACFTSGLYGSEGLIGFDFIKHFNLTFDYPDGKIVMVPRK